MRHQISGAVLWVVGERTIHHKHLWVHDEGPGNGNINFLCQPKIVPGVCSGIYHLFFCMFCMSMSCNSCKCPLAILNVIPAESENIIHTKGLEYAFHTVRVVAFGVAKY